MSLEKRIRILVADDEDHLRELIRLNLELEGYEVDEAKDGAEALSKARAARFDLIVLDIMMPYIDGLDVCQSLRLEGDETAVLFLSARQSGHDKVAGLKIGGDDYLTKPFHLEELILRVGKLANRTNRTPSLVPAQMSFGGMEVDFRSHLGSGADGAMHELGKKEALLLKFLIQRSGEVVRREEILEKIWGYDVYPSTRTVDNYIANLRKIFESDPRNPRHIHSVRGIGYRFTP